MLPASGNFQATWEETPEVVARPAAVVLRADDAVRHPSRAGGHLRSAADGEGEPGADDGELHGAPRSLRQPPRRVVELLQPERRLGAPAAAEAAADGPREPLQQRGRPAGLRRTGVDVLRGHDALLLVRPGPSS